MNKKEVLIVGIVALLALLVLVFAGFKSVTGKFFDLEEYYEQRSFAPKPSALAPSGGGPRLPYLLLGPKKYAELPPQEFLVPRIVEFRVNRVTIPKIPYYNFIPVRDDRIRTYSGMFGPYDEDVRKYFEVFLCSYAYRIPNAPARCERVRTAYDPTNGFVGFVKGFAPDEFIAYQAVGTNFAVFYLVVNQDYGVIAKSNTARVKIVND